MTDCATVGPLSFMCEPTTHQFNFTAVSFDICLLWVLSSNRVTHQTMSHGSYKRFVLIMIYSRLPPSCLDLPLMSGLWWYYCKWKEVFPWKSYQRKNTSSKTSMNTIDLFVRENIVSYSRELLTADKICSKTLWAFTRPYTGNVHTVNDMFLKHTKDALLCFHIHSIKMVLENITIIGLFIF